MRRVLALASFVVAAGCFPPDRDNPYDPQGSVEPSFSILEPIPITCAQWQGTFPFPPGFSTSRLAPGEEDEIDGYCALACIVGNDGDCQEYEILTSVLRDPVATCTREETILDLDYREILYVSDAVRRIELVVPNAAEVELQDLLENGFELLIPEEIQYYDPLSLDSEEEQYHFQWGTAYQAIGGNQITFAAWQSFLHDHSLATRSLYIGAPADGPLGGTGRMIVVYNSGDIERTQPFCTPVIP